MKHENINLALKFIQEAWAELRKYEVMADELHLRQACEKDWGAVAQALKIINPDIKRHADFGETAARLARKYNNREILRLEACGELLHREGFYEGTISKDRARYLLEDVEEFVKLIDKILNQKG
jgi:hypothetical protein